MIRLLETLSESSIFMRFIISFAFAFCCMRASMVTSTSCSLHQQDEIPMVGEHMADKMRYDQQNGLGAK